MRGTVGTCSCLQGWVLWKTTRAWKSGSRSKVPFKYSQDEFTLGASEPLALGPPLAQAPCKALGDARTVSYDYFVLQMAP